MYRVIVVDDEVWALKGMQRLLQHRADRFEIIFETTDPKEALEKICEEQPDIVFTDVRMPDITGIELMQQVKERGITTNFVVISGFADFSYVQQALLEGAIDYQLKPIDIHKVDEMLNRLYTKMETRRSFDELHVYASLREGEKNTKKLLEARFRRPLYLKLQVVTVRFRNSDFDRKILDMGCKVQVFSLKLGPRKCVYIINSENDKSDCIYALLAAGRDEISSAGISQCTEHMEKISMLLKNSELASRDYFTDPGKNHLPVQAGQYYEGDQAASDGLRGTEGRSLSVFKDSHSGNTGILSDEWTDCGGCTVFVESDYGLCP